MKRILVFLFAAMLAGQAWAQNFTIDKLMYTVTDATNNYVSVSRASNYDTPSGALVIPESVTDPEAGGVPYTVTSIANYAFHSCADITSVTIPSTVTTIGMQAFYKCTSLTTVSIPSSVTEISFDDAFEGCVSLTAINVAEGNANYASIDGVLFNNDKTELLYYPASKTGSTYSIPGTVTTINSSAFENCGNLTSITIPNSVKTIYHSAFRNCSNLTSITIPESVFTLGNYAFYGCVSLTEINVASGNRNYSSEDGVLFNSSNTKLMCYPASKASTAYTVPESVTSIDEAAFYGCSNLKSVVIPNAETSLGDGVFQNSTSLESATLPNSITYIPAVTFGGCTNLTSIEIPSTVTFIGSSAFSECGLTTLEIPSSVTEISSFAFQDCKALTTVLIPISVSDIGMNAFKGCSNASFNCEASEKPDGWHDWWNYDNRPVVWGYGSSSKTWKVTLSANNSTYGSVSGGGTYADGSTITITATPAEGYRFVKWSNGLTTASATITVTSNLTLVAEFSIKSFDVGLLHYEITGASTVEVVKSDDYETLTTVVIPETVEIDGKTYTVTRIGEDAFRDCKNLTSLNLPKSVTGIGINALYGCSGLTEINVDNANTTFSSVGGVLFNKDKTEIIRFPENKSGSYTIPNSVTYIHYGAFEHCKNLSSINIPNSVKRIGSFAFIDCISLTEISVPEGIVTIENQTFQDCTGLSSVTIPQSVTEIGGNAFEDCISLESIAIPSNVISIGYSAFRGCYSLKEMNLDGNNYYSFENQTIFNKDKTELICYLNSSATDEYTIPNTVTRIGDAAFSKCNISSITIPESVISIGASAFMSCSNLTAITIPNSVTDIESYAFEDCYDLKSIILSESITKIDRNVFSWCYKLVYSEFDNACYLGTADNPYFALIKAKSTDITSCKIHDNCQIIANGAFDNCENLQYNEYDNVLYLGSAENPYLMLVKAKSTDITSCEIGNGCHIIDNRAFYNCNKLTSITIPDGVKSIGDRVFYNCSNLTDIAISESVESIGDWTFYNCSNLKDIIIPESVESIGYGAFYDCESLTTITIPESVISIGGYAFFDCDSLKLATIPASVMSIGDGAFRDCDSLTIYCEAELRPEGWNESWISQNKPIVWNAGSNLRIFKVNATANNSAYGSVEGVVAVVNGYTTTITVRPANGYHFTSWNDNNTDNPRTLTITSDTTLTALFEKHTTVVDPAVAATCTEKGKTEGSHCSVCGATIVAQKTISPLYHEFINYIYNNDATATHDGTETAVCEHGCGETDTRFAVGTRLTPVVESAASEVNIYASGSTIVVENATEEISVYNAMGTLVCRDVINCARAVISINTAGVYIVKTGSTVKRVVVNQ